MTLAERYRAHHALSALGTPHGALYLKPGVRGFPGVHPALSLFARRAEVAGRLLDASGTAGALALLSGKTNGVTVLEPSRAGLRCALATFRDAAGVAVQAGLPWDAPAASFETASLIPATDRGSLRVRAELLGARRALTPDGALYAVMHKDQGAKRYEKELAALFAHTEVLARESGWRLVRAQGPKGEAEPSAPLAFEAAGLTLGAEPGVHAAGKLDPGTGFLLTAYALGGLASKRVLDLGCGYGLLALKAALAGADVTALDDDLGAVRSTHRNALRYGLDVRALHSDLDSELRQGERFELVLCNPPFHLGKEVRLELPHAFIAAARARLEPGGELVLVANRALLYEGFLAQFAYWELLAEDVDFKGGFKVLRALA